MVKLRMNQAILVATLAVVLLAASPASAQRTTAELRGTVTDATGGVLPGAVVAVEGPQERRDTVTDGAGFYRISYLPAGPYTVTVSLDGFQPAELEVTVALDRTLTANATLNVGQAERLVVRPDEWALDISRSSLSRVVSLEVIDIMPVNNRNYLDLIRLTPGVVNNAGAGAAAPSSLDTSGAILGERAGNASFLLDGLWNNNAFGGGVLQNLTQDTVEQFEVIATGYAAEFGQGSGGVINVITKSGTNTLSGSGFSFIRNDAMDAANVDGEDAPDLTRYNVGFTVGGPIRENRDWFFGSLEFVSEDRQSLFPQDIPPALAAQEDFSRQPELRDNRVFGKYTRDLGFGGRLHAFASWEQLDQRNQLRSGSGGLPSSGQDTDDTSFLTGATLISPLSNSTVFEAQLGVRGQSFDGRGSLGESRSFSAFFFDTGSSFTFGPPIGSVRSLDQRYYTARASLTHFTGATHTLKGGAELTRTTVDGQNQPGLTHVLLTSTANYARYGTDGFQLPQGVGFVEPADQLTRLRNTGGSLFLQDDWQLLPTVTANLGVRYEVDSKFDDTNNVAPRAGIVWAADPRTIVRASWGMFYDRYRLGIADGIPALGGFDGRTVVEANFPRLLADAIPLGPGSLATLALLSGDPFVLHTMFGIPTDAIVTRDNVAELTGLGPDTFVATINGTLAATGIPFIPVDFSPFTGFLRQDVSG